MIEGVELRVTLKAGIAVFPTDGESTEALCANAETALSKAKQSGSHYLFYAPGDERPRRRVARLEHRLRRALAGRHARAALPAEDRRPHRRSSRASRR